METKENVLTGHKAKLLLHRTREMEKKSQFYLSLGSLGATPRKDTLEFRDRVLFSSVPQCTETFLRLVELV